MSVYAYDTVLDTKNNEKTILLLMITKVPLPPQRILKSRTPSRFNFVHVTQNIQNMFKTNQNLKMRVIDKVKLFLKIIDIKQNCLIFIIFVQKNFCTKKYFHPELMHIVWFGQVNIYLVLHAFTAAGILKLFLTGFGFYTKRLNNSVFCFFYRCQASITFKNLEKNVFKTYLNIVTGNKSQ